MADDDLQDSCAAPESRSSILGVTAIVIAFSVVFMVGVAIKSAIDVQGGTIYISYDDDTYNWLTYTVLAACVVGFLLGVEGYRRPTSHKLLAIVGVVMNATLLMIWVAVQYWRLS